MQRLQTGVLLQRKPLSKIYNAVVRMARRAISNQTDARTLQPAISLKGKSEADPQTLERAAHVSEDVTGFREVLDVTQFVELEAAEMGPN